MSDLTEEQYEMIRESEEEGNLLLEAVTFGYRGEVEDLLDMGVDVNYFGETSAINTAVENGDGRMVNLLLKRGADPNTTDMSGETPIFQAIWNGHDTILKRLLESGADINITNPEGWKPIHLAVCTKDRNILRQMIEKTKK